MSVDKQTVARIAHLACIGIKDEELEPLSGELNQILDWVEMLNEVDTENVAPMASVHDETLRWRDDLVNDGGIAKSITANASNVEKGYFRVPKVVE